MGTWYEIDHVKNQPFQPDDWTCTQAQYSDLNLTTGQFSVYNSSQAKNFIGPRFGVHGTGTCPDATGQCYVSFFGQEVTQPNY